MKLLEYLEKNNIKREHFGKKIGCSYNYICEILRGRKPGHHIMKLIHKETRGAVKPQDLISINAAEFKRPPKSKRPCFNFNDTTKKTFKFTISLGDDILFSKEIDIASDIVENKNI